MSFPDKMISIHGARTHNLNNIDLSIPCNKLVVITGPSGSGKSSLAFDTIYAEGQRRYVESLSPYARQFLEIMEKPDVDQIDGLSPAISIEQKTISHNPRSTVGTITEIYDYVRLLFARTGILHSPATGKPIKSWTVTQMVDKIISLEKGTRLLLLSPVIRGRKGEFRKEFAHFMKQGFQRVKIDGFLYEMPDIPALNKAIRHDIDVIIDRIVVQDNIAERMADSLETALKLSDGIAIAELADEKDPLKKQIIFSEKFACPESGFSLVEIEPKLFSFNSPFGACPGCNGIGTKVTIDPDLVIPDKNATLEDGAITPWVLHSSSRYLQILNALTEHFGAKNTDKWKDLPPELQHIILYGAGKKSGNFLYNEKRKRNKKSQPFEGVINELQRHCNENHSEGKRREIRRFQKTQNCPDCNGHRLKPEALSVKLDGMHIGEVCQMSISQAQEWFRKLPENLTRKQKEISKLILKEIQERLAFLNNVGLPYLTLSRNSGSLSGGESQRIRLASQIGSGLTGVIYVLDEPSIGLHQRDNARLIKTLENLRELGNTVIMVEHDEEAILAADHIIDVGPFAGIHGGCIVAQGSPLEIKNNPSSLTGQYLSGIKNIPFPEKYRKNKDNLTIQVIEATGNNLKNVTATFPLGTFICVTGVSGSGKSTLLIDTLCKAAEKQFNKAQKIPLPHKCIQGLENIDKIIQIDQSPIGRTPRSNPATYTGAFSLIRDWFAQLPDSRARGYRPGRFSFNVKGGRCEACQGNGLVKIEMHFLPDVYVNCDSCMNKRYNRETLEIQFKRKSIANVLEMTVDEGIEFFASMENLCRKLKTLQRVGLGYIKIGQQATTLSGGEAQRVKLSKELARKATGRTLYILDEPTTGLHFCDVNKLLKVLHELVDQGNTVAVIEHNLEVIKTADWIIDLGPEGGASGGTIIATGTPEKIARQSRSYTGKFLATIFERHGIHKNSKK